MQLQSESSSTFRADVASVAKPLESSSGERALDDAVLLTSLFAPEEARRLIGSLDETEQLFIEQLQKALSDDLGLLEARKRAMKAAQEEQSNLIAELKSRLEAGRARLVELEPELDRRAASQSSVLRELAGLRMTFPQRLTRLRLERLQAVTEAQVTALADEHRLVIGLAKQCQQSLLELRTLTTDERQRRIQLIETRKDLAERKLAELERLLAHLRNHGITRTTAGFLVWAGYLSFTAFGWLAGKTIQRIAQPQEGLLAFLFNSLSGAARASVQSLGVLSTVGLSLLIVLGLFAVYTLLFIIADRVAAFFDSSWATSRSPSGRGKRRETSLLAWALSPSRAVSRPEYGQFIARLPFLLAGVVTVLLLAVFLASAPPDLRASGNLPFGEAEDSAFYVLLGVTLCIIIAGFAMLYSALVIEPRKRALSAADGSPRSTLLSNLEFVIVAVIAGTVLVAPEVAGAFGFSLPSPWSGGNGLTIIALPLLGGFVTAYGLFYRGLFRDYATFKAEMYEYEEEAQRYAAVPLIDLEQEEVEAFRRSLATIRSRIEREWNRSDPWLPEWEESSPWRSLRGMIRDAFAGPRRTETERDPLAGVTPIDELLEPDVVEHLRQEVLGLRRQGREMERTRDEIREISRQLSELQARDFDATAIEIEREIAARRVQWSQELAQVKSRYTSLRAACAAALSMGEILRKTERPPELQELAAA